MIQRNVVVVLLGVLIFGTGPVSAQTCNSHIPATAPDSRYTNHGNGTVTDNATGLMWKRCAEGLFGTDCETGTLELYTWQEALQHGQEAIFAGHTDWRLPNIKELSSLAETKCYAPAINATMFPNTPLADPYRSESFWSSTPLDWPATDFSFLNSRIVDFHLGHVFYADYEKDNFVRLVRGGL